jgi:formate dehydrogenase major subunit
VLVNIDQTSTYRKSQENPDILRLYDKFYGEPNSELSHKLLHTSYRPFDRAAAHEVAMRARSDATAIDATR